MPLTVMGELEQVRPSRDGRGEESKRGSTGRKAPFCFMDSVSFLYFSEGVNDCPCLQFSVS